MHTASATHTHCGPNVAGEEGWGDIDREYADDIFIPRIVEAVGKALSDLEEVKIGIGVGDSFVGVNRRERKGNTVTFGQCPYGPFDPKMTVISFRRPDGTVKANLIHYGAHGTCAGRDPNISRDWPGIMTDRLELVSGAVTAFINGPEGDVGPRCSNGSTAPHGSGFVFVEEIGNVAAFDAVRIYKNIGGYHDCTLSCKEFEINLPLAPKEPKAEVKKRLATYNNRVNIVGLAAAYCEKVIEAYEKGIPDEEFFTVKQTVLKLGNLAIVSFPFELFSEIGIRIAKASRIPTVLSVACTNGSHGYFPTESEICLGGYEILYFKYSRIQQCKPFADNYLIEETLKNLEDD